MLPPVTSRPAKPVEKKNVGIKGQLEIFSLNYMFTKKRRQSWVPCLAGGGLGLLCLRSLWLGCVSVTDGEGGATTTACPLVPKSGLVESGRAPALSTHDSCQPLS